VGQVRLDPPALPLEELKARVRSDQLNFARVAEAVGIKAE
jgi:hypothetical protein